MGKERSPPPLGAPATFSSTFAAASPTASSSTTASASKPKRPSTTPNLQRAVCRIRQSTLTDASASPDAPGEFTWILANILQHLPNKRVQVQDVEPDDRGTLSEYTLPRRFVIPLDVDPPRAECGVGTTVLAHYPGTTCFYKAHVVTTPTENAGKGIGEVYTLSFDGDEGQVQTVEANMAMEWPKVK